MSDIVLYSKENGRQEISRREYDMSGGFTYHRVDGPAYENEVGYKAWWFNGKRHRVDGPAIEYSDGGKAWWIDGKRYIEEEYNKLIQEVKDIPEVLRLVDPRKWVREFNLKTT